MARDPEQPHALPLAGDYELHSTPLPHRAEALDQVSRRLSGTIGPEQPSRCPPEEEFEATNDPTEPVEARLRELAGRATPVER